ncbi:MAG: hypothetical protein KC416_00470 [Myxococcales bacterium]|nr:hypothetical protein [Myxococcales bacterium]
MANPRERWIRLGLVLGTLAGVAFFLAQGAMALLGHALLAEGPDEEFRLPRAPAAHTAKKDPVPLLRRNIFDSATGDLTIVVQETAGADDEPATIGDGPIGKCDDSVRLVAAVVNPNRRDWSFAAIAEASGNTLLYREGLSVAGKKVLSIGSQGILLQPSGGPVCELTMFSLEPRSGVISQPKDDDEEDEDKPGRPPTREGAIPSSELEAGIKKISDTKFTVQRSLMDKLLENQGELMRSARIIPHEDNGKVVGVKLYGIRRNSLLGRLGLQNGDMLRTINGYDMTSPDKALEAYARLQSANNITVSAVRRGQATNIDYEISE